MCLEDCVNDAGASNHIHFENVIGYTDQREKDLP